MRYKFYPKLVRRKKYLTKKNGKFYVYSKYRIEIAEDCLRRCVYCDAHEHEVGGESVMELDHFRPTGLNEFKHLSNDPQNLHYSCRTCNNQKHHFWPALGTAQTYVGDEGFVDPFEVNRLHYFIIRANGSIKAQKPPAAYMINLLELDRPFMRLLRQVRRLMGQVVLLAEKPNAAKAERLLLKLAELERRRST